MTHSLPVKVGGVKGVSGVDGVQEWRGSGVEGDQEWRGVRSGGSEAALSCLHVLQKESEASAIFTEHHRGCGQSDFEGF